MARAISQALFAFAAFCLGGCAGQVPGPDDPPAKLGADVFAYQIDAGDLQSVQAMLLGRSELGPEARFGEYRALIDKKAGKVNVCGSVDAYNMFGDYIGYRPYFSEFRIEAGKSLELTNLAVGGTDYQNQAVFTQCKQKGIFYVSYDPTKPLRMK